MTGNADVLPVTGFSWQDRNRVSNYNFKMQSGVTATTKQDMRLDVQGLRAIAVLAVLAYHANRNWVNAGFVGVDVFFVISGFIITALLTERSAKVDLFAFYSSRIKRIAPAYFVMLSIVCLASAVLFLPDDFAFFQSSLKSASLFNSNHYFAHFGSYFAPQADELPLLHTWSLAIEMQFYLFFPLLVVCVPKNWRLSIFSVITIGLFVWSGYRSFDGKHDSMYFSLLARAPEFMVGAVVAVLVHKRQLPVFLSCGLGVIGAIALAASFVMIDRQSFPGFWSILPCIATGVVIAARRGPVSQLLSIRPMVWIGTISYSLYLWHWPLLALIRYYTGQYELTPASLVLFFIGSFLVAWLSYRFIEWPVRNTKLTMRQLPKWALAACIAAVVTLAGKQFNLSLVSPPALELTRYAPAEFICHGIQVAECKRGKVDVPASVLVIGDSHAAQLNYFFDEAGSELGLAYRVITSSSCVPIKGFDVQRLPAWAQKSCRAQIDAVALALPKTDKIIVAGMWQYQMQSPAFIEAFRFFLEDAAATKKQVVVLAQIPMFDSNVLRIRRFTELGLLVPLKLNAEWKSANKAVGDMVAGIPGAKFIDFSGSVFFATAPYHEGQLIYQDRHHLNEIGARRYWQYASAAMRHAFDQPQSSVSLKP